MSPKRHSTKCDDTTLAPEMGPDSVVGKAGHRSLPSGWLCSSQKVGDVKSNPGPMTNTRWVDNNTHLHSLQSFGFVTFVIHKLTSIRCNHTHTGFS